MHSETNVNAARTGAQLQEIIVGIIQKLANPTPDLDQQQIILKANELKLNNFSAFLLTLSLIGLSNDLPEQTKILAVMMLKNSIYSRSKKGMAIIQEQWNLIDLQVKSDIFTNVFQLLNFEKFKTSAPTCLANLCVMESQNDIWKQLVSQLEQNVRSETASFWLKQSSLTTLGYVAQEMTSFFTDQISSQILNAVAYAVTVNELKQPASVALYNVLDSIYDQVEIKDFRDQVLKLIIQLTLTDGNTMSVRDKAYACLVKVADLYYKFMSEYIEGLFNITVEGMSCKDSREIIMHSIEFWKAVCQKEHEILLLEKTMNSKPREKQSTFYSREALPHIIFTLLHHLKGNCGEEIEGWNPCSSAAHCLTKLAECWSDLVLEYVGQFFSEQIVKPEWYSKNASVLALGSIIDELTEQNLSSINSVVWPYLIDCLNHQQSELRDTACWVIGKIGRADPNFIATKKDELLPLLIKRLDDDPKVVKNASIAITQIIESLKGIWSQDQYFYSEDDFIRLIKMFLRNSQQPDVSLTVVSFSSISSLINCIDNQSMQNVAQFAFTSCFESLQSAYQFHQQSVISSVILTIQTIIDVFGPTNFKMCHEMMQVVEKMCENGSFIEKLNILPDVLTLITVIVSILDHEFNPYINLANKLILVGMNEFLYDSDTCKAAIGLLSILASFLPDELMRLLNEADLRSIMRSLFKIVEDQSEMGLPLKHTVIDCFGDLILNFGAKMFPFGDEIMKTILSGLASDLAADTDIYQYNYAVELYCSCMNALSGTIQSMCKPSMTKTRHVVGQALPIITKYLISIAMAFGSNENIQMIMIALIGDMSQCFPEEMLQCLKQPLPIKINEQIKKAGLLNSSTNFMQALGDLLKRVKKENNDELKRIYDYTLEQLKKAKIEVFIR